ncbi:RluA family pseudouridine synthase [Pollutibacter soli]|uniref:RluA family pseudouridine synthase n=1 Tax=Pollutibacter soli TaxID=3034157 RepID=UPI003013CB02
MNISEENASPVENEESGEEWYERLSLKVDKGQEPLRIDKFLIARIGEAGSRNKIQHAIERGMVQVNSKNIKSNYKIKPGDQIIYFSETTPEEFVIVAEKMDLPIIYEDDDIIVVNKTAGMVVHPGNGNYSGTLLNGIAWHLKQQQPGVNEETLPRFGMVHRIDKNTSGLLLLAKTDKASRDLANQFFEHTVIRRYHALVWGDFEEEEGTITGHVGRHQRFRKIMDVFPDGDYGKEATTHYTVLERFRYVTLVECRLETGRTHQIRVHMQHIGHPLFNDETYGGDKIVKGTIFSKYKQFVDNCFTICPRQALHAKTLGFIHPRTRKEMFFESDLPADMAGVIEKWRGYVKTLNVER